MAEDHAEPNAGNSLPPRIKLNGANGPNGPQAKPPPRPPQPPRPDGATPPPKITIPLKAAGKTETSRIDLAEAKPAPPAPPTPETVKKSTVRIDTAETTRPLSEAERLEAMKKSTVRVQIEPDKAKRETAPLQRPPATELEAAKKKTARIDLQEVLGGDEDIFKRRTTMLDASKFPATTEAPGVPKTIRIKRPEGGAPPGPVRPAAEILPAVEPIAAEARKSETARIELPAEVAAEAPTRRKTIRIKRPEGVTPAKPFAVTPPGVSVIRPAPEIRGPAAEGEEVGATAFSLLALAAVLVACVLIYVLAAQVGTLESLVPPRWPFPGGV